MSTQAFVNGPRRGYINITLGVIYEENCTMGKEWPKEETQQLEKLFGTMPTEQLAKQLGRSEPSLHSKAYTMGLNRQTQYNPWSVEEMRQLEDMFPTTSTNDLAKFFGRSVNSVRQKAFRMELKKSKEHLKSIGLARL